LRAVVEKHGAALHVVEIAVDRQGARVAAFAVQVAATDVRTHRDTIQIALGGPAMNDAARREELYRTELAPYVDLLATLHAAAADVTATLPHRLLFDGKTFATYLVYWGDAAPERLRMTLVLPVEGVPGVHDVIAGARSSAANYSREQATGRVQADVPLTG